MTNFVNLISEFSTILQKYKKKEYLAASSFHLGKIGEPELFVKTMILWPELGPSCHAGKEGGCYNTPAEFTQSRGIVSKTGHHSDVLVTVKDRD